MKLCFKKLFYLQTFLPDITLISIGNDCKIQTKYKKIKNKMYYKKKGLTCVVTGVPPSTTSDWLAPSQIQQVHWELEQTERSIILWTEESRSRVWQNIRCSVSVSGFLSPGLWSFPVFSFWCLALQTHEWPQEGRFSHSWRPPLLQRWCSNTLNLCKILPQRW